MNGEMDMDDALHAATLRTLVRQGCTPLDLFVHQLRTERRDARVDAGPKYTGW